jgi:hypothetical protein
MIVQQRFLFVAASPSERKGAASPGGRRRLEKDMDAGLSRTGFGSMDTDVSRHCLRRFKSKGSCKASAV